MTGHRHYHTWLDLVTTHVEKDGSCTGIKTKCYFTPLGAFRPNENGEPDNLDKTISKICGKKIQVKWGNTKFKGLPIRLGTENRFLTSGSGTVKKMLEFWCFFSGPKCLQCEQTNKYGPRISLFLGFVLDFIPPSEPRKMSLLWTIDCVIL